MYYCYCPLQSMKTTDDGLEMMYPKIYHKVYPMVMSYCDSMEKKYGPMYRPSKEELKKISDDMYEKMKDYLDDCIDDDDTDDDDDCNRYEYDRFADNEYNTRQRRYGRRRAVRDLFSILLLSQLFGRRPYPYYSYYPQYPQYPYYGY
ncbi:hypothetical protein CPJCM30710_18390 [Clostridium polyendosporum]|uniref:Uncharacterized protein n=1 Tax=Clostridium polyendosporum TaxID=69208 RepID=A0A919S0R6_9CLOT|nr:hypothetical protein [Clostridium polyendosporum]GIM29173.1 hypothetical protein CPJCM30710_18390 [Clostridium polyendosporum]